MENSEFKAFKTIFYVLVSLAVLAVVFGAIYGLTMPGKTVNYLNGKEV